MRLHRTTGLDDEQLEELVERVAAELDRPWNKATGRPCKLDLGRAVAATCMYLRHNVVEKIIAEIFGVTQSTISRVVAILTDVVSRALAEFVPATDEAAEMITGQACLVDSSLSPCWSWQHDGELWSGKHNTTGHNRQVITDKEDEVITVSAPVTGNRHDTSALAETGLDKLLSHASSVVADKGYQETGYITPLKKPPTRELTDDEKYFNAQVNSIRAPIERAIANLKTWRVLHTDYRRPLHTYLSSFNAALALYFFTMSF